MSALIGVYKSPDAARVEQDDEARRALDDALKEGGRVVAEFSGTDGLRPMMDEVARNARAKAPLEER